MAGRAAALAIVAFVGLGGCAGLPLPGFPSPGGGSTENRWTGTGPITITAEGDVVITQSPGGGGTPLSDLEVANRRGEDSGFEDGYELGYQDGYDQALADNPSARDCRVEECGK